MAFIFAVRGVRGGEDAMLSRTSCTPPIASTSQASFPHLSAITRPPFPSSITPAEVRVIHHGTTERKDFGKYGQW
ncbi:hypothetical protein E2C01_010948 [Portunus trituberculatus]|uniref:Uncharacterized protein n=1 Tax=Portunus trituberculatus TaxID=210409 RepID=A0A5B7D9Q6_PORTR|nr:hypothetical protein [Portunus trituberculatus]